MNLYKGDKELITFLNTKIGSLNGPKSRLGFFRDIFKDFERKEKEDIISFRGELNYKTSIGTIAEVENYYRRLCISWMKRCNTSNVQSLLPYVKAKIVTECAVLMILGARMEKQVDKDIDQIFKNASKHTEPKS